MTKLIGAIKYGNDGGVATVEVIAKSVVIKTADVTGTDVIVLTAEEAEKVARSMMWAVNYLDGQVHVDRSA